MQFKHLKKCRWKYSICKYCRCAKESCFSLQMATNIPVRNDFKAALLLAAKVITNSRLKVHQKKSLRKGAVFNGKKIFFQN